MYIDLIIVVLVLILVLLVFRRFSSFVYAVAIIDIFLRIVNYVAVKITLREVDKFFPDNIPHVLSKYTKDIVYDILEWAYVFIMACFLVYIFIYFIKKRK